MRNDGKISILHILGVRVLHDLIREFARDSVSSIACNFVRNVAVRFARASREGGWDIHYERYQERYLEHSFRLKYVHEARMMRVKHQTFVDRMHYDPEVKRLVLRCF